MADGFVQVPLDSVGKKVDAASLDVGASSVMRQRFILADNSATAAYAIVTNGALTVTGTFNISAMPAVVVSGTVSLGPSTNNIGGVSLVAGTALIGAVSNAAGTALMGAVSLATGTANIGFINNISATVIVAGEIANGSSLSTTNKPVLIGGNTSAGGAGGLMATLLLDTTGAVKLGAGTNLIGAISNAAGTALMGAVSLAAGTANIGFINNISATVIVAGIVSLGAGTNLIGGVSLVAGTANIGFINNISATVIVAGIVSLGAGTNLIGAVSLAAGTALIGAVSLAAGTANIGFINNISATVIVAGVVSIGAGTALMGAVSLAAGTALIGAVSLGAGTANIGTINGISATISSVVLGRVAHGASVTTGDAPVQMGWRANLSAPAANISNGASFGWSDKFGRPVVINNHPSLLPTASHGPKCVTCSTSAGIALIAAPGAGLSVFITTIACTNGSGTLTRADVFQVSSTASCTIQMYMAASGGGFVYNFNPPVQYLSNSGVTCRVKPSVSQAIYTVHFYVGPK
jgi:putative membrane protein